MISADDLTIIKPRTSHVRRPEESIRTKGSNPSSSNLREELTKEGARYVHNFIAKIVKWILDENHQVSGISVPLQIVIPDPPKSKRNDDDVHVAGSDIHMTIEDNNEEIQEDADKTNVTEDVNDIENFGADDSPRADAGTGTNVVDVDEYSDNDLVSTVNPSVAERLMTRRKGKAVMQKSLAKKADVKSPSKDSIKKKSTTVGPIKSRVVAKSFGIGPSKSWSKVVPKKRKARAVKEFESDVEVNVHDIPLKKKPTTSKLATSVPEVPIDNVSFHFAASANRWKFEHQKRLALERELAQNARNCKDIMDLIEAAGLIKSVVHLSKCYEMLVKEFDEAQPELEVSDNKVCQVITANQVRSWPLKGKLSASKLSMKYAMLHKIGVANWVPTNHKSTVPTVLGRFIYAIGTKAKFDYGTYNF
ncbi:uncharacterized protein LOC131625606 [Vicia villosa]|uniref:uncharacterized protein LOC131625606 n=1 Tax=Vicia villosa TaxID=3911 RepID=UPI00273B8CAA|nr:uncharacterized protein LOC131625606 [Vicia villosa]